MPSQPKLLVDDEAVGVLLAVGGERKDGRHLEVAPLALTDHLAQDAVVRLRGFDGVACEDGVEAAADGPLEGVRVALALGLLIEVLQDVGDDVAQALGLLPGGVGVDALDLHVGVVALAPERTHVVDLERQHVTVVDGVDHGVGVQAVAEGLRGGAQVGVLAGARVLGEDWRAREAEQMVVLERLGNSLVHLAELRAVAFVEDEHGVAVEDLALALRVLEVDRELVDGGDADLSLPARRIEVGGKGAGVLGALNSTG